MSKFELSIFEFKMLLHYAKQGGDPFESTATGELLAQTFEKLNSAGLIARDQSPALWMITNKGLAWLDKALSTPLPVQKWVWE